MKIFRKKHLFKSVVLVKGEKIMLIFKEKAQRIIYNYIYMILVVGLGNPGRQYEHTHHNMGFDVVDKFADSLGVSFDREGFKGVYTKTKYFDEDIIILKPYT